MNSSKKMEETMGRRKRERRISIVYERYPCGAVAVTGTSEEIVEHMFANRSPFLAIESREDFIKDCLMKMKMTPVSGDALAHYARVKRRAYQDQCRNFVRSALRSGWIKRKSVHRRR